MQCVNIHNVLLRSMATDTADSLFNNHNKKNNKIVKFLSNTFYSTNLINKIVQLSYT